LARAKNTQRAEARRRHRETVRTTTAEQDATLAAETSSAVAATQPSKPSGRFGGLFTPPNLRKDIQALPDVFSKKRNWVAFAIILVGFVIDAGYFWGYLPADAESIAVLSFTLILSPQALFVPFIAGFLAEQSAYLVGALVGLFDAVLVALLFNGPVAVDRNGGSVATPGLDSVAAIFVVSVVFSTLAAAFASWYRRFLRQSQERARVNRMQRDALQAAKKKEDEKKARAAERDSKRTAASTSSNSTPAKKTSS
jgi:hypothetical protein